MVLRILPAAALLLASCSAPDTSDDARPGTLAIDRIERQLAGRPCIGALDRWERHYFFGGGEPPAAIDRNVIHFTFGEAGVDGFRAGRRIDRLDDQFIYDGLARIAFGEYHVASGRLFVHTCGKNNEPPSQSMFDSFNRAAEDLR